MELIIRVGVILVLFGAIALLVYSVGFPMNAPNCPPTPTTLTHVDLVAIHATTGESPAGLIVCGGVGLGVIGACILYRKIKQ